MGPAPGAHEEDRRAPRQIVGVAAGREQAMSDENVVETEAPAAPKGPTFAEMGLRDAALRAVTDMGFTQPMQVQAAVLPLVREGRDLMVQSRTGSGKTA